MTPEELWEGRAPTRLEAVLVAMVSSTLSTRLSLLFSSRNSAVRDRGEKPLSSTPASSPSSRPGPFTRGGSSKELPETQSPEDLRREREKEGAEPRRPSVTEDKTEPERSKAREPGENFTVELFFFFFT